ncbi:MAG: LytTR family transcriptional regulator DNA-binding domain-containing protein [Ignavibacteriaceae bacterium]|nr:LytTR family transcriptional regulator DNA-binding domain-containing protein [Ignavibacteriaceae bacterium]
MKKFLTEKDGTNFIMNLDNIFNDSIYIVYGTTFGKEWIEFPKTIVPDLLFCDSKTSLLSGNQISQEITNYDDISIIPFLYLSTKVKINNMSIGIIMSADDYIIKPINGNEWFKRIEEKIENDKEFGKYISKSIKKGNENLSSKNYDEDDRLFIDSKRKPKIIRIGDISYITSKGNDSIINLSDMFNLPVRKTLNRWEELLPVNIFKRINRSTIINLKFVESISRWSRETYIIHLKNIKEPFNVSYRYAREMRSEFK